MVAEMKVIAAIGNFDGVHRGHQALLSAARSFAIEHGAQLGVVLFDPHPRRFFTPDTAPFLLTGQTHRDALLRDAGVKIIHSLRFDVELANTKAEDFIGKILKEKLGLSGIVAGTDFRFGAKRAGDAALLTEHGADSGLAVKIVELVKQETHTDKFGSSGARKAIAAGDMAHAASILGREWSVRGVVEAGEQRGRTIGFPTANLLLGELIAPKIGVYAIRANVDGETYSGVANYGRRPTVGAPAPLLEAHLFDFSGDLYGKQIEVAFVEFLRDERKFDGLDALRDQIAKDCEKAQALLGAT